MAITPASIPAYLKNFAPLRSRHLFTLHVSLPVSDIRLCFSRGIISRRCLARFNSGDNLGASVCTHVYVAMVAVSAGVRGLL